MVVDETAPFSDGERAFVELARPNTSDSLSLSRLHAGVVLTIWPESAKGEAPEALEYEANGELEPENAEKALTGSILVGAAGFGGVIGRAGGVSGSLCDRLTWGGCGVEQRPASIPFSSGCDKISGCTGEVGWRAAIRHEFCLMEGNPTS